MDLKNQFIFTGKKMSYIEPGCLNSSPSDSPQAKVSNRLRTPKETPSKRRPTKPVFVLQVPASRVSRVTTYSLDWRSFQVGMHHVCGNRLFRTCFETFFVGIFASVLHLKADGRHY